MIITFPRHKLERCDGRWCDSGCPVCAGLAICVTCGGAEGDLTKDCPQEPMREIVRAEVYAGRIDYHHKRGWFKC